MFDPFEIERMIKNHIPQSKVEVRDMTGGADHFEIQVKSPAFKGKSMIDQHKLVYQALGDAMNGAIHAVQIKTEVSEG